MERPCYFFASPALSLQTMAEKKQREARAFPHATFPTVSAHKPPALIPIARSQSVSYKPFTPYSIDDILSRSEARSTPRSPPRSPVYRSTSPHHSLSPAVYEGSVATPHWWHGIVHTMWKERLPGMVHLIISLYRVDKCCNGYTGKRF